MTTPALRAARTDDLPVLLPLVRAFYAHFGYPYSEDEKRRALEELLGSPALGTAWLVLVDGEVAGYSVFSHYFSLEFGGRTAFVDELYVVPAHRGRGVGTAFLELLAGEAQRCGLVALHLESEAHNTGATALYERLGFVNFHRHLLTRRLGPG